MKSVVTLGMVIDSINKWADDLEAAAGTDRLEREVSHVIVGMHAVTAILRLHKIDGSLPTNS